MLRRICMTGAITVLVGCALRRTGLWSNGKPIPVADEAGRPLPTGLSEKLFVDVNGVPQGMFIQSTDVTHPVLLYLHGGLPEYFLTERYTTGLEDDFTVVWWEQRGAGLSYSPQTPPETLTLEQLIADTVSVTNYLRERFGKEQIYLMGHSGGSFIGLQAAARVPHLYAAYIGVAQMVNARKSEKLAYDYLLDRARVNRDTRMARRLEAAPVTITAPPPQGYLRVRDKAMHRYGVGTTRDMNSVLTGIVWPSLRSPQYTLREKIRLWRGKLSSGVSVLWEQMLATDLTREVTELALPLYLFHGVYDYTCSYPLAREYFAGVNAPLKGFYTFERSAHSPIFEEPDKARRIMREDVRAIRNQLADARP